MHNISRPRLQAIMAYRQSIIIFYFGGWTSSMSLDPVEKYEMYYRVIITDN